MDEALADIEDAAEEAAEQPGATARSMLAAVKRAAVPYHAEAFSWEEEHSIEHAALI